MFNRYRTAAGRPGTQKARHDHQIFSYKPKRLEMSRSQSLLRSILSFLEYSGFYTNTQYSGANISLKLIDHEDNVAEHMLQPFEEGNDIGFSFVTGIPTISPIEEWFIEHKADPINSKFTIIPPDIENIKRKINTNLESLKQKILAESKSLEVKVKFVPLSSVYKAYVTIPKEETSILEAPVVKAPIEDKLLELKKAPIEKAPAVKKAPTKLSIPELQIYYNALKDVIGETEYKSVTFTNTGSDKLKGITTHENTQAIAKKHHNSEAVVFLEDVSTNTHIAFTGRLQISSIQKYVGLENWTKDNEAEEKALGLKVTYTYPGLNKAKNIIQQAVENAKANFINSASHISYPPQFLELFNIKIQPYSNSHEITVSISKEEALKALGSQPNSRRRPSVPQESYENKLLELKQPTSRRRPSVPQESYEDKLLELKQPTSRRRPSVPQESYENKLLELKKAPKPEAFQPVTPKTRAFKKAPVVKSLPVKKSPTIKNPPIKLSVAELHIEKELSLLNSYMDFNNLSPSEVNEIVLTLKPLTDKVIRNDQFAVYDKKLTPSTDKSSFLSPRLVAKITLLFKQLNKFYDLSDLEPIELVEVISQIVAVFNKLPAYKITSKKASFDAVTDMLHRMIPRQFSEFNVEEHGPFTFKIKGSNGFSFIKYDPSNDSIEVDCVSRSTGSKNSQDFDLADYDIDDLEEVVYDISDFVYRALT